MESTEALEDMKKARADGEKIVVCASGSPDSGTNLTRPAVEIAGTLGTAASLVTAADAGGATGACCLCAPPSKRGRSQVENGAVKGTTTRTTSQEAKNLGSIGVEDIPVAMGSKRRATSHRGGQLTNRSVC